jgi:hypothetical protein
MCFVMNKEPSFGREVQLREKKISALHAGFSNGTRPHSVELVAVDSLKSFLDFPLAHSFGFALEFARHHGSGR